MVKTTNINQSSVPILNEKNYDSWFIRMRTLLHSHDLWGFVTDGCLEPANEAAMMALTNAERTLLKDKKKKDNKALGLIQQSLDGVILSKVSNAEYSKEAWDILESCYQGVAKVNNVKLQNLRRDFENLKMKDSETVDAFMTQVMSVVNQL